MSRLSEKPSESLIARERPPRYPRNFLSNNAGLCSASRTRRFFPLWSAGLFRTRRLFRPGCRSREASSPLFICTAIYPCELHRELRGCVGYAVPIAPLYRAVAETARAAAFEDSRFLPVTKEEAPQLEVSLSVLSRLFPIHPEAVEVGRHGLLISDGARRGLLLPQVPVEHGWDRETFLEQTCRKAGLPLDAWRKAATIEAFTAEVFGDARCRKVPLNRTKEKGEIFSPPRSDEIVRVLLLLLVQFHRVARVHIFQREDDHGGRCGRGHVQNHHFSHGAPRQIAHMNVRPFGLGEAIGLKSRRAHLRVF